MNKLIESVTNKVINDFNNLWQIENRENEFKSMINELNKNNKYLNDFVEDIPTKNFDSKIIFNCMKYYNDNISKIKNEFKFLGKFRNLIKNNRLIGVNQNFNVNKFQECFFSLINNKKKEEKNNNNLNNKINMGNNNNQNEDNFIVNDKIIMELDKLIIKPKFEYSLNAQRV